jgi:hypothetical protein
VRIAGKEVLEAFLKRLKELLEELKKATGATTAPSATLASSVAPAPSSTPEQPKTPEPAPAPAPAAPEKPKPPSLEESLKKDISFADFKKGVEIGGKIVKIIPESAEILVGDTRWHFRLVQPNMPGITASFSIGSIAWDSATGELAIQAKGSAKLLGVLLGQKDIIIKSHNWFPFLFCYLFQSNFFSTFCIECVTSSKFNNPLRCSDIPALEKGLMSNEVLFVTPVYSGTRNKKPRKYAERNALRGYD